MWSTNRSVFRSLVCWIDINQVCFTVLKLFQVPSNDSCFESLPFPALEIWKFFNWCKSLPCSGRSKKPLRVSSSWGEMEPDPSGAFFNTASEKRCACEMWLCCFVQTFQISPFAIGTMNRPRLCSSKARLAGGRLHLQLLAAFLPLNVWSHRPWAGWWC